MSAPNVPDPARSADYVLRRRWLDAGETVNLKPGFRVVAAEPDDQSERILFWVLEPVEESSGESNG